MKQIVTFIWSAFFLLGCEKDPLYPDPTVPDVRTIGPAVSVTYSSAKVSGEVSSAGGAVISARGICWAVSPNPTINNNVIDVIGGVGMFTADLTTLSPGTLYYVRAYVVNSVGTDYGNQVNFTTLSLPTLTTSFVTSITTTSAVSGGFVSSSGSSPVTARGICWSTSPNPTTALITKTVNGSGTGSFSSSITGLTSMTNYYVRAYATNAGGTNYGTAMPFRTN